MTVNKNDPRLGGSLLDVIPRRLNGFQPLDTQIIAEYYRIFNNYLSMKELGYGRIV